MKLSSAAKHFDTMPCLDGYTGASLFSGQLGLFDDNKRDSETSERRILSVGPDVVMPSRRVVQAANSRWIIGHSNPDYFKSDVIRVSYVVHEANELSQVRTLQQVVLSQLGFSAYAGRAWVKNMAFTEQNSKLAPEHHIHFSPTETIPDSSLVTYGGRLYLVRTSNLGAGGTIVTTCDELPEPSIETGSIINGVYDAVSDSVTGTSAGIRILRMRWQSLFAYRGGIGPTFGPDDMQVAIPKSITVLEGARLTLSDGQWFVASVNDESGVWLCRVTRHV